MRKETTMSDTETPTAPPAAESTTTATPAAAPAPTISARPAFIPEKFWDGANRRVRLEEMAKSYGALERRMSRAAAERAEPIAPPAGAGADVEENSTANDTPAAETDQPADEAPASPQAEDAAEGDLDVSIPASPEEYAVAVSHPWLQRDGAIDSLLHACGFNQAQAQLVYDLAAERVVPAIERMAAEFERRLAQAKLEQHFGGAERFAGIARQVKTWAERHLPKPLYESLASTPDRTAALHHMMRAGEPRFVGNEAPASGPSQGELDALVRDPRYWRDRDPALAKRIEEGFRRLYPGV